MSTRGANCTPFQTEARSWGTAESFMMRETELSGGGRIKRGSLACLNSTASSVRNHSLQGTTQSSFSSTKPLPLLLATGGARIARGRVIVVSEKAWLRANVAEELRESTLMPAIDRRLHAERCIPGGSKVTFDAPLVELPRGAMFEHEYVAYLVGAAGYLPWSFDGYGAQRPSAPPRS